MIQKFGFDTEAILRNTIKAPLSLSFEYSVIIRAYVYNVIHVLLMSTSTGPCCCAPPAELFGDPLLVSISPWLPLLFVNPSLPAEVMLKGRSFVSFCFLIEMQVALDLGFALDNYVRVCVEPTVSSQVKQT